MNRHTLRARGRFTPRQPWTPERDEIVRQYDGKKATAARLAALLNTTQYAVLARAGRLGLTVYRPARWSIADDAYLMEHADDPLHKVAKHLGRSQSAVVQRRKRLGLLMSHREGWYTLTDCMDLLGVQHQWLMRYIERGELKAERLHGDGDKRRWRIEERDLKRFVREHLGELRGKSVDLVGLFALFEIEL